MRFFALSLFFVAQTAASEESCDPSDRYVAELNRCCLLCPPGAGMALPCTKDNSTSCLPCIPGETFSIKTDHAESCRRCDSCPINSHASHKCNVTHNTVCQCNAGFYPSRQPHRCVRCQKCAPGNGVVRDCGGRNGMNVVCEPCRSGETFSTTFSDKDRCKPCSKCGPNQIVAYPCLATRDTVCQDIYEAESMQNGTVTRFPDTGDGHLYPYIVLLAAVICFLVYFALTKYFKWLPWFRCRSCGWSDDKSSCHSQESSVNSRLPKDKQPMLGYAPASTLSKSSLDRLCRTLDKASEGSDWRAFAGELGIPAPVVASFSASRSPCSKVIDYWQKHSAGQAEELRHALLKIGQPESLLRLRENPDCLV